MSKTFWNTFYELLDFVFDDSEYFHQRFFIACKINNIELVNLLLLFDCDPLTNNAAIRVAAQNGHIDVVDRLLQDGRVDPSADDNFAIRIAYAKGHVAVVDRLLQDETGRVDPSAVVNFAIRF